MSNDVTITIKGNDRTGSLFQGVTARANTAFARVRTSVRGHMQGAVSDADAAGKAIGAGLADGAESGADRGASRVRGVFSSLFQGIAKDGDAAGRDSGSRLSAGLSGGVSAGTAQVRGTFTAMFRRVEVDADKSGRTMGGRLAAGLRTTVMRGTDAVRGLLSGNWGDLGGDADRDGRGIGSKLISGIAGAISSGADAVSKGLSNALQAAGSVAGPVLIGVLGGVAVAVGPAIGAMMGGGIVLGLGAGLVGLGAVMLFHTEKINKEWSKAEQKRVAESNKQAEKLKKQFTDLQREIISGLKEAAQPLVGVLDTVRSTVRDLGKEFKPVLTEAFASAKVPLQSFVRDLGVAFKELKPAVQPLMNAFTGLLGEIGPQLKGVFTNIASSLKDLATTVLANKSTIATLFTGLLQAIPVVISAVSGLVTLFGNMLGVVSGVNSALATVFVGVTNAVLGFSEKFLGVLRTIAEAIGNVPGMESLSKKMVAGLDTAIAKVGEWKKSAQELGKAVELKANIFDLSQKIDQARAALADPNLTKERRAQLNADITKLQVAKAAAVALLGDPKLIKEYKSSINTEIGSLKARLADAKAALNDPSLTRERKSKLNADIAQLKSQIAAAKSALNSLQNKTVRITTIYSSVAGQKAALDKVSRYAHGGIIGAAGGGPRSNTTLVGEQGPEIVKLPFGSTVIPAGATKNMLASERRARSSVMGDLTLTRFGKAAGNSRTEMAGDLGAAKSVGELVSALNRWRTTIKETTHGVAEGMLLKNLDVAGKALLKNETLQGKVNDALDKARLKLSELKDAFSQVKESITANIAAFGNVTRAAADGAPTLSGIISHLSTAASQSATFANALATLKKRGVDKNIIADVAAAGLDGGGLDTAKALLQASSNEIKQINKLQSALTTAAKKAGQITADSLYGAGIKAAEGVVKGLEKNKAKIEKAMMSIATALEKAVKKAFGVTTTTTKKKSSGGIIGAAGGGPRSAMTLVGEQGPELVNLPFGSSVIPAGQTANMLSGGGGTANVVLEIVSGGSRLDDALVEILRNAVRGRGGNVQQVLGR